MEIGNQIRALRLRRGLSQEIVAQHLGVTAQAVSKWERGVATPDIGLLPELSAYFGVTIDALFALSDDTRMERIQNMLWDVRWLDQNDVESARDFLLRKGQIEPENGRVFELLADMENHIAREHHSRAAEYAKEALRRDPALGEAHTELVDAMGGQSMDWNGCSHYALIDYYKDYLARHPDCKNGYLHLMEQLLADDRLEEAAAYLEKYTALDSTYRTFMYRGKIAWAEGNREEAFEIWKQMEEQFPEEWVVFHKIADYLTRAGKYEEAEGHYRKAIRIQAAPRYVDPIEALSQLYQRMGAYDKAIAVLEEELKVFETEWNFTEGETADVVRREIQRLAQRQIEAEPR